MILELMLKFCNAGLKFLLTFFILFSFFIVFPTISSAATIPYTITEGIPGQKPTVPTFLTVNFDVNFQSGQIIFSGNPDGTGNTSVDDAALVWVVKRPDGTSASQTFNYSNGCMYISSKTPQNITSLFKPGVNQVQVRLYDVCGGWVGSSPLYLVNLNAPDPVATKTPIIIVPGIAASLNRGVLTEHGDSGWSWMYTAEGGWRQFIDSLEKAGYQKDKDYFIAFYDWRKTNDWTDPDPGAALPAKKYLVEAIDKAKIANPGIAKVNVVAHSMGGLVVKSYVESPNYRGDIDKAFLIGSPNSGSSFAYYTWEGAEIPPNWDPVSKAVLNIMIKLLSFNFNEEPYQMIHDHMKGIKDLLPVGYDYIFKNNNPLNWTNMQEVNNFLKNTSNSQNTFNIFTSKGVQLTNITGTGQTTWEKLQVEDYIHQYLWKDGKPIGNSGTADGDNTVLVSSSSLPGAEQLSVASKHANLPNSATSLIFNKLGITYTPSNLAGAPDEVIVAWVASPVTLTVKDSLGNSVGELLTDPETDRKWVFVENPGSDYEINLTGTGNGQYHVGVDYYTDTKTESSQTQGTVITGAELNYDLHLDSQNPQPLDLQPEDKIAPITSLNVQGTSGTNNWYLSDVNVSLSVTDNTGGSGVDKTEYSFNNTTWQTYTAPLAINKEGITPIYYRSSDLVGNTEQTQQIDIKIDKTAPEVKIAVDPDKEDLVVSGIDQNSTTVVKNNNTETRKKDDAFYEITDLAGNITRVDVRERDKGKQDRLAIFSIKYNDETINKLPQNHFNISYTGKRTRSNINEQNFELKGETKIRIQYNQKKNQSTIIIREPKQEKVKEIKDGLVILNLSTNHGSLEANY